MKQMNLKQMNRYGLLRLQYLKTSHPSLLQKMQIGESLHQHLLDFQRNVEMEIEQLVFAGLDDCEAERYVFAEYLVA